MNGETTGVKSVHNCCVFGCGGRIKPIHHFPNPKTNLDRFRKWVQAAQNPRHCNLTDQEIYRRSFMCYKHFKDEDYKPGMPTKKLKFDAVPSVNLPKGPANNCLTQIDLPPLEDTPDRHLVKDHEYLHELFSLNAKFSEVPSKLPQIGGFFQCKPSAGSGLGEMNANLTLSLENEADILYSDAESRSLPLETHQDQDSGSQPDRTIEKPYFKSVKSYVPGCERAVEVCRICFRPLVDEEIIKLYEEISERDATQIKTMLRSVLPNLDLDVYSNIAICTKCTELLAYSYQLQQTWLLTEEKLKKNLEKRKGMADPGIDLVIDPEDGINQYRNKGTLLKDAVLPLRNNKKVVTEVLSLVSTEPSFNLPVPRSVIQRKKRSKRNSVGPGTYICEQCGRLYENRTKFQRHLRRHKFPERRKPVNKTKKMCEICGKSCYFLKAHLRMHTERQCKICNEQFRRTSQLVAHMDCVHLKKKNSWQCHLCGKVFSIKGSFKVHLTIHDPKNYHCNICNKMFTYPSHLRKHLRRHVNEKNWKCKYCGRALKHEANLQKHINIFHRNQGKFACDICNKPFWKRSTVDVHKNRIHGIV